VLARIKSICGKKKYAFRCLLDARRDLPCACAGQNSLLPRPPILRRHSLSAPSPSSIPSHPTTHQNTEEGKYTKTDCLRLAKTLTDLSQVPAPCKEVVQNEQAMRKAFEGATVTDRARHAIAMRKGTVSHHQLQRRITSTSETMAR
jgi:hypothetical protein